MNNRRWAAFSAAGLMTATTVLAGGGAAVAKGGAIGGSGTEYLLNDSWSADATVTLSYGSTDDDTYVGNWDGADGDSLTVRRGSRYHVRNTVTAGPADRVVAYGRAGDTVLVGDWDGDGTDTLAVRRGDQYLLKDSLTGGVADRVVHYGRAGDTALVGDWDGDGADTLGVRRGSSSSVSAGSSSQEQSQEAKLPVFVSPTPDRGSSYMDAYEARRGAGWGTAFYTYWPGEMRWNGQWADFVARHPEGIPVLGSPKGTNASNVRGFLDELPTAWRDKWIMAYHQEPEDNFTSSAQRAEFRRSVAKMADLVRPYGVRNAVHLQEWTINPYNNHHWGTEEALAEFFDAEDIDYLSWSLYPAEGKSMKPGIDRIKAFSEKYAPGVPWGITAAGSPVPGSAPIGGSARAERAQIVREAADYTAEVGGQAFGWFDFDEFNPGRDQLAAKDPALRAALRYAAEVDYTRR